MSKKKSFGGKNINDLDELIEDIIVDAYDTDEQLWAFRQVIEDEALLPADAFVIGEPVSVIDVDYDGNEQRGLTATCRREDGSEHVVALFDVIFPKTFQGIHTMAAYRRWLNLDPWPDEGYPAKQKRKHKIKDDDIDLSKPVDLVVLSVKESSARCRPPESDRELTLRTGGLWGVAPGMILTVSPRKHWRFNGHPYLSGTVQTKRIDAKILGLAPLSLAEAGMWSPEEEFSDDDESPWITPIIKAGPRPMFEMEQVVPGEDPDDPFLNPITRSMDFKEAGNYDDAIQTLLDLCREDLRCIDAHAHLGNFLFNHRPQDAIGHYEVGLRIGELSLGEDFTGLLPWDLGGNRPFLRCLYSYGLCLWRLARFDEAAIVFDRLIWLNPSDAQGVRFLIDDVKNKTTWEDSILE